MPKSKSILERARFIDAARSKLYEERLSSALRPRSEAWAAAVLLCTAYPAFAVSIESSPGVVITLVTEGYQSARSRAEYLERLRARICDISDAPRVLRELRRGALFEKIRIALREVLSAGLGGADVDVTAAEYSALAEATIEIALEEAIFACSRRFGPPLSDNGKAARFCVLGMGKLGGHELNPGSDVDLIYLYDTDEGFAQTPGQSAISLHDFWTRTAKRLTQNLEEVTEDGIVWRVDLRLRPEGRSGAITNSIAAAERYYESFGRLWERAALLRARPIAGDPGFGNEAISVLSPFIWRRRVDPSIALEMANMAERARDQFKESNTLDLKLSKGGIREAEFFVQSLELIWGGREPRVRERGTLDGLRKLRAAGFVTDREALQMTHAYLLLRRAEHAIQLSSGLQTHSLPKQPPDLLRIARMLGAGTENAFREDIRRQMQAVESLFASLLPEQEPPRSRFLSALGALDKGKREAFAEAFVRIVTSAEADASQGPDSLPIAGPDAAERWRDVGRDLSELARHPDGLLGTRTRELFPHLAEQVLDAITDAADPEQAARYLRIFISRLRRPGVYAHLLGGDMRRIRRLVTAIGASAFIGDALIGNPELGDVILFSQGAPSPNQARRDLEQAVHQVALADDREEAFVEALRKTKARITIEVGLSDLQGEIGPGEGGLILSALADTSLSAALRFALSTPANEPLTGLCVLAMGKLGGCEIGYGSDLDVIFLYDPEAAPSHSDPGTYFSKCARRVIRLISASHPSGPGYELDTRLRPSGSQGLLVTSIGAFARYHGVTEHPEHNGLPSSKDPAPRAAPWERLALLRARACAGDSALGQRAMHIVHAAAYGTVGDPHAFAREIDRLRKRMEHELSGERGGRYDPKLGRGGLLDIEMAVQLLQVLAGHTHPAVCTTDTLRAVNALRDTGHLTQTQAEILREGYLYLRKLQWRMRIVHASTSQLIEEGAPGLVPLAHRMGIRSRSGIGAAAEFCAQYRAISDRIRNIYDEIVLGLALK